MQCVICGRQLKSSKSRELGYGPVCYKKMFGYAPRIRGKPAGSSSDEIPDYDIPGQMTVEDYLQTLTGA